MAINVNVISENTTFNVANANYCTVALPITACWGPCFSLPTSDPDGTAIEDALENTAWSLFNASPDGLESFIATYRGPSANYRATKDYSYFMALSLLNSGYAVQTCRLCPGTVASLTLPASSGSGSGVTPASGTLTITAKYPGTFGNNLKVSLKKKISGSVTYWNLIGYAVDSNGTSRAVENLVFVFNPEDSTDTIVTIKELQSKFFNFRVDGTIDESLMETTMSQSLIGGSDVADASAPQTPETIMDDAIKYAKARYGEDSSSAYIAALQNAKTKIGNNKSLAEATRFNEWVYTFCAGFADGSADGIYELLKDKINYNPNRIICPWDDQNISNIDPDMPV